MVETKPLQTNFKGPSNAKKAKPSKSASKTRNKSGKKGQRNSGTG